MVNPLLAIFIGMSLMMGGIVALAFQIDSEYQDYVSASECVAEFVALGYERSVIHTANGTCILKH
jgi:hypothetical protein